ncbi:MAG: tol-pal system-associated acyl-CoA thioesterase [Burkholderiaceae bacterium]|nr:tol-pal system-associated acyl-CoA thioesterase [Burkholderiaceae bacterium]
MTTAARSFSHPVRIYWEDTDAGGVVFYANYLKFFERARTEWLRALGFGQQQMRNEQGLIFVVTDTAVRYLEPARLDDELTVTVTLAGAARATLRLAQAALRGSSVLAESRITLACVEAASFRPKRLPQSILDALASTALQK